jgi:murein DD-endopeptidase MepM/ murein hydrolase activator NlpD
LEKKIKFTENPTAQKIVYGVVVAILCVAAIVVGIIAANQRVETPEPENPPTDNGGTQNGTGDQTQKPDTGNTEEKKLSFISPVAGSLLKGHSDTTPVYSTTLEEWRLHTGIDIMTEEAAPVFAAEDGEVSKIYNDPLYGKTVEISHADGMKTVYKNLLSDSVTLEVGSTVKRGEKIAKVGDSAIIEIADEAHLHFEMEKDGKAVNPLDYITLE